MYESVVKDDPVGGFPLVPAFETRQRSLEASVVETGDSFVLGSWLYGVNCTALTISSLKGCLG